MLTWVSRRRNRSALLVALLCLSALSCSSSQPNNNLGSEICSIYASAVSMSAENEEELALRAQTLSQAVRKQLPEFYENHYVNIVAAPLGDQYRLTKMVIKNESGSDWDCPYMKSYIENIESISD